MRHGLLMARMFLGLPQPTIDGPLPPVGGPWSCAASAITELRFATALPSGEAHPFPKTRRLASW